MEELNNNKSAKDSLPHELKGIVDLVDLLCKNDHFEFGFGLHGSKIDGKNTYIKLDGRKETFEGLSIDRIDNGGFCLIDLMCDSDHCSNRFQCENKVSLFALYGQLSEFRLLLSLVP